MNVWVAYLNLENMYGTDASLQKLFLRALQYNDPLKVYRQMIDIYSSSDKTKACENTITLFFNNTLGAKINASDFNTTVKLNMHCFRREYLRMLAIFSCFYHLRKQTSCTNSV